MFSEQPTNITDVPTSEVFIYM